MSTVVAGIDSSTQSTKVVLRSVEDGQLVARATAGHPAVLPPRSEQDPERWWSALRTALDEALRIARERRSVELLAIAVAGQQHGMVALDATGDPVHPAKLWNDTESAPDSDRLISELGGPEAWADAVGSVPLAAFTITKLAWLRRVHPGSFARCRQVLLPHDYLTARLTGALDDPEAQATTDRGDASGSGYWSPTEERYRTDLLDLVDPTVAWDEVVPPVLAPVDVAGRFGEVVVAPGTGDNMAAALGVGLGDGEAVISIGTSGTAYARADQPAADATGAVAGFADATGRFLPLACTSNAARVLDTIAGLLGVDHAALDRLAGEARHAVPTLLPYLDGERTPSRPGARGLLAGVRTDTGRAELARAAVDGVAYGLLDAFDALRAVTPSISSVLLTGGGAGSRALVATIAALVDFPVYVIDAEEVVATGAAVQAAAVGTGRSLEAVSERWSLPERRLVEPADDQMLRARRNTYLGVRDGSIALDGRFDP